MNPSHCLERAVCLTGLHYRSLIKGGLFLNLKEMLGTCPCTRHGRNPFRTDSRGDSDFVRFVKFCGLTPFKGILLFVMVWI